MFSGGADVHKMRRSDRLVTDEAYIDSIISDCDCIRLGFVDDGEAYIVPLTFGFEKEDGKRVFYIHSATEGRKIDLIKKNGTASFEMDCGHNLKKADEACKFAICYKSVMGRGSVSLVEGTAEKERALGIIMRHYSGREDWTFQSEAVSKTAIIKVTAEEISCKECNL